MGLGAEICIGLVLTVIAIASAIGNSLVILSVILVKKLQTPSNFLIVSLAVSDFLVSVLVFPFGIYKELSDLWYLGEKLCDFCISMDVLLCTASILNLCAISVDRYLAITKPLQYAAKRTPKRMIIMIICVWLLSALISIPPMFEFKNDFEEGKCDYSDNVYYQIYATFCAFYLPLFVMIILYIRIFKLARRMARDDLKLNKITQSTSDGLEKQASLTHGSNLEFSNPETKLPSETQPNLSITSRKPLISPNASIEERYPLPPSSLSRRKYPRLLHPIDYYVKKSPDCKESQIDDFPNPKPIDTSISMPFVDQSIDTLPSDDNIAQKNLSVIKNNMDYTETDNFLSMQKNKFASSKESKVIENQDLQTISFDLEGNTNHLYKQKSNPKTSNRTWQNRIHHNQSSVHPSSQGLIPRQNDEPIEFFVGRRKSSSATLLQRTDKSNNNSNSSPYHERLLKRLSSSTHDNFALSHSRNTSWISLKFPVKKRRSKIQGETKAIKTLGIIMGCFCCCWIPFFIIAGKLHLEYVFYDVYFCFWAKVWYLTTFILDKIINESMFNKYI